jgi:hypothetical protein
VVEATAAPSSSSSSSSSRPASYAARLLGAMEEVLVLRKMASAGSRRMVDEVLARPLDVHAVDDDPHDVVAQETQGEDRKAKKKKRNGEKLNRVGDRAYRFHFDAKPPSGGGGSNSGGNAGFHRLLLHAVCQFHGMIASSSTTTHVQDGQRATERVLTVTGTCRGREHRIVDAALRLMQEEA